MFETRCFVLDCGAAGFNAVHSKGELSAQLLLHKGF